MFVAAAILQVVIMVVAYSIPAIRNVEDIIPDHQERMDEPFEPPEKADTQAEQQPVV